MHGSNQIVNSEDLMRIYHIFSISNFGIIVYESLSCADDFLYLNSANLFPILSDF